MVGCTPKPSLVGKWNGQVEAQGQVMNGEIDVSADKMVMTFDTQGMKMIGTSSYKIEGDKITTTLEDVKISGANLPPQAQAMFDAAMEKEKGKTQVGSFTFKDADTVEMSSSNGEKMTWTRVK